MLLLLTAAPALHAQVNLSAGAVHAIAPFAMACLTNETIEIENPQLTIRKECADARSILLIQTDFTFFPQAAAASAGVKRVAQFRVQDGTGSTAGSWLPVHVAIPVSWIGRAFNDSLDPTDLSAYLAVNATARLTEGMPGNPAVAGRTLYEVPVMGFTHGGPNACLSVPKGKVSAALTAVKCVLGAFMKEEGDSHVDLVAVVQVGRTYNIEVDIQGDLYSQDTGPPVAGGVFRAHPKINFESGVIGDPFGLTINGDIRVTVGTSVAAELQELRDLIDDLRRDLENHTHEYLTGRGIGHNNVAATTSAALLSSTGSSEATPAAAPADPQPPAFVAPIQPAGRRPLPTRQNVGSSEEAMPGEPKSIPPKPKGGSH
jgi:hypothetical protein